MRSKTKAGRYARLKEPLVRDGSTLRPAGWDEALDRAAKGLRETDRSIWSARVRNVQLLQDHE